MSTKQEVLKQLDSLIETGKRLEQTYKKEVYQFRSSASEADLRAFVTSAIAAVERVSGKDSQYFRAIPHDHLSGTLAVDSQSGSLAGPSLYYIPSVSGALIALRDAVDQGLLESLESRLRANIHDDFLMQALELLDAGYHVAAMVLTGGVLEDHLKKIVLALVLTMPTKGSISKYNDLLKDNPYNQSVWRRIQSIGDLRNDAAHGEGSTIDPEDVKDAHRFVQRFITDHPA